MFSSPRACKIFNKPKNPNYAKFFSSSNLKNLNNPKIVFGQKEFNQKHFNQRFFSVPTKNDLFANTFNGEELKNDIPKIVLENDVVNDVPKVNKDELVTDLPKVDLNNVIKTMTQKDVDMIVERITKKIQESRGNDNLKNNDSNNITMIILFFIFAVALVNIFDESATRSVRKGQLNSEEINN